MARLGRAGLVLLVAIAAGCNRCPGGGGSADARPPPPPDATPPQRGDLQWSGNKSYTPPETLVNVQGFGVNADVAQLPTGTASIDITRPLSNAGPGDIAGGYQVQERVERMILTGTGTSIGYVVAPGPPVFEQSKAGPPIAAGQAAVISFDGIPVPSCGLYRETLTADLGNTVSETDENNNVAEHFFFVDGTMRVHIAVAPNNLVEVWHSRGPFNGAHPRPAAASGIVVPAAFPHTAHTFTVTPATPGTTFSLSFHGAPVLGPQGSQQVLVQTGPGTVVSQLTGNPHHAPLSDITRDVSVEVFTPKVHAVTGDGCSIRTAAAIEHVVHPAN